jgi:hypothetical protein
MMQILQDSGFRYHFIAYVAVNLLLLAVNLLTTPSHLWFYWPLLGWGIGIVAHGAGVYRRLHAPPMRVTTPEKPSGP